MTDVRQDLIERLTAITGAPLASNALTFPLSVQQAPAAHIVDTLGLVAREKLWRLIEEGWEFSRRRRGRSRWIRFHPVYGARVDTTLAESVDAAWAAREATR
jgi:hypothetical protein